LRVRTPGQQASYFVSWGHDVSTEPSMSGTFLILDAMSSEPGGQTCRRTTIIPCRYAFFELRDNAAMNRVHRADRCGAWQSQAAHRSGLADTDALARQLRSLRTSALATGPSPLLAVEVAVRPVWEHPRPSARRGRTRERCRSAAPAGVGRRTQGCGIRRCHSLRSCKLLVSANSGPTGNTKAQYVAALISVETHR